MRTTPVISVITPTYNRRAVLERAIRSVQRQTLSDYEHIIVDDCSQDDTEPFVRGLADSRIRYTRFDRWRGANEARNAGIQEARSEWLTFLDSDDEFLPQRLESTVEIGESISGPELLISSFQTMKRGRLSPGNNPDIYLSAAKLERALILYKVAIAGTGITVRRKTVMRAGGFGPTIRRLQDREMLLRLSRYCGAQLLSQVDWIKHPSPDSISGPRNGYVESLGAMFEVHPGLSEKYREVISYHVARHMLTDLVRGRWRQAYLSLRTNYSAPALGFTAAELVHGYRAGSKERREFAAELEERIDEQLVVSQFRSRRDVRPIEMAMLRRAA